MKNEYEFMYTSVEMLRCIITIQKVKFKNKTSDNDFEQRNRKQYQLGSFACDQGR